MAKSRGGIKSSSPMGKYGSASTKGGKAGDAMPQLSGKGGGKKGRGR
jgi:hypothetical protein